MRRVLPLVCAAGLLVGATCINLTPPHQSGSDGGAGSGGRGGTGGTGGTALVGDGGPDVPDATVWEVGPEAPREGGGDARSTLHDGLVGYWKLDESTSGSGATTATDSSGLGNHGQIKGSPTRVSSDLPPLSFSDARAFTFAGQSTTDDAIEVPDSASLRPTAISVALWVKFVALNASSVCGSASAQMQYIVHRRNTRGANGMFEGLALIKQADGTFAFLLSANDGTQIFASSITLPASGQWYHLVGTYDGSSRIRLYVDGTKERERTYSNAIAYDATRPLYIGRTGECGGTNEALWDARLNGTLDDIRVYNREITPDEVLLLAGGAD